LAFYSYSWNWTMRLMTGLCSSVTNQWCWEVEVEGWTAPGDTISRGTPNWKKCKFTDQNIVWSSRLLSTVPLEHMLLIYIRFRSAWSKNCCFWQTHPLKRLDSRVWIGITLFMLILSLVLIFASNYCEPSNRSSKFWTHQNLKKDRQSLPHSIIIVLVLLLKLCTIMTNLHDMCTFATL